jgi:hypothetical protein
MAQPYKSQLEFMRQTALSQGVSNREFWSAWRVTFDKVFSATGDESDDFLQYQMEMMMWGKESCNYSPIQYTNLDKVIMHV